MYINPQKRPTGPIIRSRPDQTPWWLVIVAWISAIVLVVLAFNPTITTGV